MRLELNTFVLCLSNQYSQGEYTNSYSATSREEYSLPVFNKPFRNIKKKSDFNNSSLMQNWLINEDEKNNRQNEFIRNINSNN